MSKSLFNRFSGQRQKSAIRITDMIEKEQKFRVERLSMRKWLTFKEVAQELQIPLKTIYQYHYLGKGPKTHRFGKHLRVLEADLIAWEEQSSLRK